MIKVSIKNSCHAIIIIMLLYGCSTERYARKKGERLINLYGGELVPADHQQPGLSRKEIRSDFNKAEKYIALMPDSLICDSDKITCDSFYFNKHKILYIRKNSLQSETKFLIDHR